MRHSLRQMVVAGVAGVLLGGVVSAVAHEEPEDGAPATEEPKPRGFGHHMFGGPALRSEHVVPDDDGDGFDIIRTDSGTLREIEGSTLTIEEADGTIVEITVADDTGIRRDGDKAEIDDLEIGDHAKAIRVESDGEEATRSVLAFSPERYEELQQRMADGLRRGFRFGRFGPRPPADAVTPEDSSLA